MKTKAITALFTLLFSISANATTIEGLIKTYGKEAIMKAIALKIDKKFTIEIDGATRQAYAPSADYITASTLTADIERAGMTVKSVENVFLDQAAQAKAEEKRKAEEQQRIQAQIEKKQQEVRKYREEDIKFFAEASESERQQFRMARLRGSMSQYDNKEVEKVKTSPSTAISDSKKNCDGILAKQKEIYANKYPNNFTMQKVLIEDQCRSYLFLQSYNMATGVPDAKIAELKQIYINKYPDNYTMQKILVEDQVKSFLELNR